METAASGRGTGMPSGSKSFLEFSGGGRRGWARSDRAGLMTTSGFSHRIRTLSLIVDDMLILSYLPSFVLIVSYVNSIGNSIKTL